MAVEYILGRAGRGKTRRVFDEIKYCISKTQEERLFLIVPEQFTLQAERDLIQHLNTSGIMRVEVLSFTRLAYNVFNEVGGITRTPINDQGKSMVLRKIVNEIQGNLSIYGKTAHQPGFIEKYIELISSFKRNNVYPEDIKQEIETLEDGMMKEKLKDIVLIYERILENSMESYMDNDDQMAFLLEKMSDSDLLKNAYIWIDGFSNFPKQSMMIIHQLMKNSKKVTISLPVDTNEQPRDREIFQISNKIFRELRQAAKDCGLKESMIDMNQRDNPYIHKEICHIEKEIYAYPYKQYLEEVENVMVFKGSNIYTEVEYMTSKIIELIRERDYKWRDIAIVCNNLESYGSIIRRSLEENEIPYFLDQKRSIMNNPIIEYILSTLEVLIRGYHYQDVSRMFKTGFSDLTVDEYEVLENYMIQYGIRWNKWKKPFEWGEEGRLGQLNEIREKFITPLAKIEKKLKGKQRFLDITKTLYDYLEEVNLREKLENWIEHLRGQGLYEYVNENTQIWNIVMDTLDQLVEILGEEEISLREYYSILQSGFSSFEIGIIPTTLDQVLVGQIQRSKSHDIKALFVLGVNDGILPSGLDEKDILSNDEKMNLQQRGIDLGTDYETRSQQERYLVYSAISKPQNFLWFSYPLADGEGKALRPSSIIDRVKKIFPKLEEESDIIMDLDTQRKLITTPNSTFKHLIENLRLHADGSPIENIWWDAYGWFYNQPQWSNSRNNMIEGLFHENQVENVGKKQAKEMYKYPIRSSISRLETYVNCPFGHFIKYGLKPKEIREYKVEAPDIGELFHDSIAQFTDKLRHKGLKWTDIDKDLAHTMMAEVIDDSAKEYGEGVFYSTHRYKYLVKRLKRVSQRAIWTLTSHLKQGHFELLDHEIIFGKNGQFPPIEIELSDGSKIYLEGRIDRIDILEAETSDYVKVIDYKSGNKDFSLSDVYYGLSLQLMIYMGAVLKGSKKDKPIKPAGVFYFKIDDPMAQTEEKIVEKVEEEIERKLKMKGLVLKDTNIVRAMDTNIDKQSKIIPVGLGKNDSFYKSSSVLEEEGFFDLLQHTDRLIRQISEEMLQGNIKILPVKEGKATACDYCTYTGICQFDTLFENNQYNNVKKLEDEEVLERIRKDQEVEKNGTVDPKSETSN